jgi:hypothetical protein
MKIHCALYSNIFLANMKFIIPGVKIRYKKILIIDLEYEISPDHERYSVKNTGILNILTY